MYLRKCKTKFPPFAPKISLTNKTCKSIMSYHLSYSNQLKTCQKPVFFKSNLLVEKLSCPRWLDRFFIWALVWVWRIHNRWGKKTNSLGLMALGWLYKNCQTDVWMNLVLHFTLMSRNEHNGKNDKFGKILPWI